MTEERSIKIHRLIVHKVDRRTADEPQLSDLDAPMTEEVERFIRTHISGSLEHRHTRTAGFSDLDAGPASMSALSRALLSSDAQFIPKSREIAQRLFDTMDRRVSPGDLAICTFSMPDEEAIWLALLKMDPQDGFVGELEAVNGNLRYVLRSVPDVLPRTNLQKCAFIAPEARSEHLGYDLKVLDQQAVKYGLYQLVASFFLTDFLQCRIDLNAGDKTKLFVYGSKRWLQQKLDQWPRAEIERFREFVTDTVQGPTIDVAGFAQRAVSAQDEQIAYLDYMKQQGLDDFSFDSDPQQSDKLAAYTYFEGSRGLRVRIETDALAVPQFFNADLDPVTNEWVVTIRTPVWNRTIRWSS
jgi:hypothetical protein